MDSEPVERPAGEPPPPPEALPPRGSFPGVRPRMALAAGCCLLVAWLALASSTPTLGTALLLLDALAFAVAASVSSVHRTQAVARARARAPQSATVRQVAPGQGLALDLGSAWLLLPRAGMAVWPGDGLAYIADARTGAAWVVAQAAQGGWTWASLARPLPGLLAAQAGMARPRLGSRAASTWAWTALAALPAAVAFTVLWEPAGLPIPGGAPLLRAGFALAAALVAWVTLAPPRWGLSWSGLGGRHREPSARGPTQAARTLACLAAALMVLGVILPAPGLGPSGPSQPFHDAFLRSGPRGAAVSLVVVDAVGDEVPVVAYPGLVTVVTAPDPDDPSLASGLADLHATVVGQIPGVGLFEVQVPDGTEAAATAALRALPSVHDAFPSGPVAAQANGIVLPMSERSLRTVFPPAPTGADVLVPDDFRAVAGACDSHGNEVAAIAAGALDPRGTPTVSAQGIQVDDWMVVAGDIVQSALAAKDAGTRHVVSLSIGRPAGGTTAAALREADALFLEMVFFTVQNLPADVRSHVVVAVAAGNNPIDLSLEMRFLHAAAPDAYRQIAVVGGTDPLDGGNVIEAFDHGAGFLYAPADHLDFEVAQPDGRSLACHGQGGTSFAAPQVAHAAAVLWHQHPAWSPSQVLDALRQRFVPPLPDLAVEAARVVNGAHTVEVHAGDLVTIDALVRNVGAKASPASNSSVFMDDVRLARLPTRALGIGEETPIYATWTAVKGTHKVLLVANDDHAVVESDDTNDTATLTVQVGEASPAEVFNVATSHTCTLLTRTQQQYGSSTLTTFTWRVDAYGRMGGPVGTKAGFSIYDTGRKLLDEGTVSSNWTSEGMDTSGSGSDAGFQRDAGQPEVAQWSLSGYVTQMGSYNDPQPDSWPIRFSPGLEGSGADEESVPCPTS